MQDDDEDKILAVLQEHRPCEADWKLARALFAAGRKAEHDDEVRRQRAAATNWFCDNG
jgi:hypothetical protein